MRFAEFLLTVVFVFPSLVFVSGCGASKDPTVAPRTAEEVEAYKAEVYTAEEEDSASQDE